MNKIIYLDAAATYQKSDAVLAAMDDFLRNHYANAGRGICQRVADVDDMLVRSRARVAAFMNARPDQIIFTSGTTMAMNQIADMIPMRATTRVMVSDLDHHSARLPFVQRICDKAGQVVVCPLDENNDIDVNNMPYADVVVITAMSNVLGQEQDVAKIIRAAKDKNPSVITIVDAAQFVVHKKIDVREWDCDYVCWSAHKIGADTGLGIIYKKDINVNFGNLIGGGMVKRVNADGQIVWADGPERFEPGTLPLTQIAGLIPAIDNLEKNRPNLGLIEYLYDELVKINKIKILTRRGAAVLTFVVDGMHPLDFGALVGVRGFCVRVGIMCASWIMQRLNVPGAIRVSIGAYNSRDEIDCFIKVTKEIVK
ncbi:MAG: aminotransferase class V-fold PLP-dependent enzyme [Alphaproteobacteria bacterium]|nr:aminotransferase class V-fold PLP-dependent enzyme [Alphaproteobacteria bacterium]